MDTQVDFFRWQVPDLIERDIYNKEASLVICTGNLIFLNCVN